ncbi:MAG: class I SAM-dependent methyltransferase [Planctomycetes bacterium]|nr:class I SAM-dependent methyltransferase [Planctomycetota bacterium]
MKVDDYPVFTDPEGYSKLREPGGIAGWLKTRAENKALTRCLGPISGVTTVLDIPCGPGRLFPYWHKRGFKIIGMDFSEQMVEAALKRHQQMHLPGRVQHGDAFRFEAPPEGSPELVASVRFVYYFEPDERVALMKSLANASSHYVLIQFKSAETWKGQRNAARSKAKARGKRFCTNEQILKEVADAGLTTLRLQPIGEFSDRAFLLAEKGQTGARAEINKAPGGFWAGIIRLFG